MTQTKIVVTGMGAVTPIGIGVDAFWHNLLSGACGVSSIVRFDASELPVRFGGMVTDFDAEALIPKDYLKNLAEFGQFAFVAAEEALEMSGIEPVDPLRTGIIFGTGLDGITEIASTQTAYDAAEKKKVSPRFVPRLLGNMPACQIAIAHNLRGPNMTVNTACSSSLDAVFTSCMLLRAGMADTMVAVGSDACLCSTMLAGLASAHALSRRNEDPARACRPFDLDRDGFVVGEGGGALILETEEHAKARGAHILAEIVSCANGSDAFHVTAPRPGGEGAALCMADALARSGLPKEAIGFLNAHGTSTVKGDACECAAIRTVFGDCADRLPVSSIKASTGHMMGACGIVETISCIQAIREDLLPPTLNYETPDPNCNLDIVHGAPRAAHIDYAMNNALGFGGQNSTLIVGRRED